MRYPPLLANGLIFSSITQVVDLNAEHDLEQDHEKEADRSVKAGFQIRDGTG